MHKSQAPEGPEDRRPDDRSRIERARDEMSPEAYEELLRHALELTSNA